MEENKNDILWRIYLVYFITILFALVIFLRVIYIQVIEGEYWRDIARNSTMRYVNVDAVRGDILADDGRLLATSVPVYEIRMDLHPEVISDQVLRRGIDSLAFNLSRLFNDRSPEEYKRAILQARRERDRYFLIKRNVNYHQYTKLKNFPIFRLGRFQGGLIVNERTRRETPFKSLASRTIGFEREGVYVGLEGAFSQYLEGVQGKRLMRRISGGNWIPVSGENEIQSKNGKDIVTTININIQDIAQNELMRQLERFNAQHGTVVVMEVETGRIKGISNLTRNEEGGYEETFNYAIGESTEPGSTFKLATLMIALDDNIVRPDDSIKTGSGSLKFSDRTMRDARMDGFGTITVQQAFEVSSNVAMAKITYEAYNQDPMRFVNRLIALGLNQPLGVEIRGEGMPFIPNTNHPKWSGVTLPWMAIGYGVSLTPMQILVLYNSIANNGRMMKPMFVDEVRYAGNTIKRFEPQVLNRSVASDGTLRNLQRMLIGVVENGTATNIRSDNFGIAGKTGTALVANRGEGYRDGGEVAYRASFVGYFPADNPEYSMIVVIHNPKGYIFSGGLVAAPVFKEIAERIYATRPEIPELLVDHEVVDKLPVIRGGLAGDIREIYRVFDRRVRYNRSDAWVRSIVQDGEVSLEARELIPNLVPDVTGLGLRDALYLLENAGLKVRFVGRGVVRAQTQRPGTRVVVGSEILITLS